MKINGNAIYLLGFVILCLTVLVALDRMGPEGLLALVSLIVGYYVGNYRGLVKYNGENGGK